MFQEAITAAAQKILDKAREKNFKVAVAESCTGGLISAAITDIAGSSDVFDRSFVTYSNDAKMSLLGVRAETLNAHGAVSRETAREMVIGAIAGSNAQCAVSVTGIAGPGGGGLHKPVGKVFLAAGVAEAPILIREMNYGDLGRTSIRLASTRDGLRLLAEVMDTPADLLHQRAMANS